MSDALAGSLLAMLDYLLNAETPWSAPIALVIPRDHFFTVGDTSDKAAGSASEQLKWWTDAFWSPATR